MLTAGLTGEPGTYGAAASDISPDISGGQCSGRADSTQCNGYGPLAGFVAPTCPKNNCGKCYRVTNQGGVDGASVGGVGNAITVQIIDSCPSTSGQNYCKKNVPANQRCGDPNTNQLDIDQSAYVTLTGLTFGGGPTLKIGITPWDCPSGDGGGSSTDTGSDNSAGTATVAGGASATASSSSATSSAAANGGITQLGTISNNPSNIQGASSFLANSGTNSTGNGGNVQKKTTCRNSKRKAKARRALKPKHKF